MGIYRHVQTDLAGGWRRHEIVTENAGPLFATVPVRPGSDEDRFIATFLTRALAAGGTPGRMKCRHQAVAAGRGQNQHFVCDPDGRPLLRTLYVTAGTEHSRQVEKFLQEAVAALGG
ncbi:MAG: hypothetical protein JXB13_01705 [Phycisphaerae bacterium]|nr:hypothetical protein [Phycisphaerae bacterium]